MSTPGANRSSSGPELEKSAMWSPLSLAPTATAEETQAGNVVPSKYSLPAATTVATPLASRSSIFGLKTCPSSEVSQEVSDSCPPRLRFMAAMGVAGASEATWSTARRSDDSKAIRQAAAPQVSSSLTLLNTCTATMLAPGATPPWPAAMPATWVPCSQRFSPPTRHLAYSESAAPVPVIWLWPLGHRDSTPSYSVEEKHASATILPPKKGWSRSMPVSRMATACPAPVLPSACTLSAPITGRLEIAVGG
ncbi:hypothetical protein GCM10020219_031250 [Nonomuraea dietziae]